MKNQKSKRSPEKPNEPICWIDGEPDVDMGLDPSWLFSQKAKADAGKPKLTLVPLDMLEGIAKVREFGNTKYEPDSWKNVAPERYKDAAMRHMIEFIENEDSIDEESGLPTFDHLLCNLAFLAYFRKHNGN